MEIIGVLLFLATAVGVLFLGIFFWAYRGRQFDDIESPARRMLFESDTEAEAEAYVRPKTESE
ncbi:MAG: cbb3-type cytochrome oxidase assembly protein CcoS [bacterium]|nr:cbb3-type cytochrome oxidase assembly protein CcoS [bacterium]